MEKTTDPLWVNYTLDAFFRNISLNLVENNKIRKISEDFILNNQISSIDLRYKSEKHCKINQNNVINYQGY